jgi:hypothetical protein
VNVLRHFGDAERVRRLAAALAERVAAADVDRGARPQVREREVHPSISPESGSEKGEQRLVLVDRQQLSVAQRPALRGELEGHHADLREERLGHGHLVAGGLRQGTRVRSRPDPNQP